MVAHHDHEIVALRTSEAVEAIQAQYEDLLRQEIFPKPRDHLLKDGKSRRQYEKLLITPEARSILTLVWKESGPFSDSTLTSPQFSRHFTQETLNSWNIATKLSHTTQALAKTNTRIRNIACAAEAFYLIDREVRSQNRRPLQATPLLHLFMIKLNQHNLSVISELIEQLSLRTPHINFAQS
jgi:hypothetical protein